MRTTEIKVDGRTYPCRSTLGAMLMYKRTTGKDVSEMDGSITDLFIFLWCCVVTSCRHDGVEFRMSLEEFGDSMTPEDLVAWTAGIGDKSGDAGTDKKKL